MICVLSASSNGTSATLVATLVPILFLLFVCLLAAIFALRRRTRNPEDDYAHRKQFKLEEMDRKGSSSGTPSKSYNQVWAVFRQNLATGILSSHKRGTSGSASTSHKQGSSTKSKKSNPVKLLCTNV